MPPVEGRNRGRKGRPVRTHADRTASMREIFMLRDDRVGGCSIVSRNLNHKVLF